MSPPQLKAVAWIVATKPQKKTQKAHHLCGENCFQPMQVHLEKQVSAEIRGETIGCKTSPKMKCYWRLQDRQDLLGENVRDVENRSEQVIPVPAEIDVVFHPCQAGIS